MAKKGKISELYDINSLEAQQKTVIGLIDVFLEKVNAAKPIKVQFEGVEKAKDAIKGIAQLSEVTQDYIDLSGAVASAQEKLKKSNKDLGDSFANVGAKINAELGGSTENAIEKLLKLSEALKANRKAQQELASQKDVLKGMNQSLPDVIEGLSQISEREKELKTDELVLKKTIADTNKEIKQRLSLSTSEPGTRQEIKQTITELKNLRDLKVDINTDEGQAKVAELNAEIDRLNKILEQTGDKLEKRKINIGNYPGAVKVLESALTDVNKKIDDFTNSGNKNEEMLQALIKEQQLLQSLIESQANGFATLNAELKENEKALLQLKAANLEDSEAYKVLFAEVAKAKDELQAFKKELATRGSGELALEGAIQAAQTLAGIYGIAEGAAALFGEENEELQKTFVKLQAVIAILNGLEAINNAIKKENALRTALNVGLQKVTIIQTNLETAAQSRNIIVKYAAIAAQKALNAAMSLAGGPLLAIIGLLALVVISLSSFSTASQKAARDFERLNEEFKGFEQLLNDRVDLIKQAGDITVAELEQQFADEERIRKARRKALVEESAEIKKFLFENADAYREAFDITESLTQAERAGKKLSEEEKKRLNDAITFVDQYTAVRKRSDALEVQLEVNRLNNQKAAIEEGIKARQDELEIEKVYAQSKASVLNEIVGDERKSYDQRRAALQEFQRIQSQIIEKDKDKQLLVPTLTPAQHRLIIASAKAAQDELQRNTRKQNEEFNRQEMERERKARYDIIRTGIEVQAAANQDLAANETKSFDDRLAAAEAYRKNQEALIVGQRNFELANANLTATERKAIEDKANTDILRSKINYLRQIQEIASSNVDAEGQARIAANNKERDEAIKVLNERLNDGKITLRQYNEDRLSIEKQFAIQSLSLQVDNAQKVIDAYKKRNEEIEALEIDTAYKISQEKDVAILNQLKAYLKYLETLKIGTKQIEDAENKLAELQKNLSDEVTNRRIDNLEKLKEKERELGNEILSVVETVVSAGYDREKNAIQEQIDTIDERTKKEIDAVNATSASEQEKADRTFLINAQAQAQKEVLEQRQRKIDVERARFEKLVNIASITGEQIQAVAKLAAQFSIAKAQAATLLTNPVTAPLAPAAFAAAASIGAQIPLQIAIGAAQIAKVAATPIPKFAEGTWDAPGGWSWVGDGGKKELVVEPTGKAYKTPATATLMDVPQHSVIFPDADAVMRDLELVAMSNISKALNFPITEQGYGRLMTKAIETKLDHLTKVVANKHELHIKPGFNSIMALHRYGSRWNKRINEQTKF